MAVRPVCTPDRKAYAAAITELLAFLETQSGTTGGRAAAQVLLACYNARKLAVILHAMWKANTPFRWSQADA